MSDMHIALIRQGSRWWQSQPHQDREEAARYAFRNGPQNAKVCSTSRAYLDPSGNWRSNGMDIRWHRREDYFRDPPKACDAGLFGDGAKQLDLLDLKP